LLAQKRLPKASGQGKGNGRNRAHPCIVS
jgi:hypothetical protein